MRLCYVHILHGDTLAARRHSSIHMQCCPSLPSTEPPLRATFCAHTAASARWDQAEDLSIRPAVDGAASLGPRVTRCNILVGCRPARTFASAKRLLATVDCCSLHTGLLCQLRAPKWVQTLVWLCLRTLSCLRAGFLRFRYPCFLS
jgi:hypothetical protein